MRHIAHSIIVLAFVSLSTHGALASDLTIGKIVAPKDTVGLGCSITPQFWVKNLGTDTVRGSRVSSSFFDAGGAEIYSDAFVVLQLPPTDSALYTIKQFTPATTGRFELLVSVNDSTDVNHANDTAVKIFEVVGHYVFGKIVRQFDNVLAASDSPGGMGMIQFDGYQSDMRTPGFLNEFASPTDSSPPSWLVRNLRFTPVNNIDAYHIGVFVDFRRVGLAPNERLTWMYLRTVFADTPWTAPPPQLLGCGSHRVEHQSFAVAPNNAEDPTARHPAPRFVDSLPVFTALYTITDTIHRDTLVSNYDLDSAWHVQVPLDHKGDWCADGPATISDGMDWLQIAHPNAIRTGLSYSETFYEISSISGRTTNGPLSFRQFIMAELAFIDSHRIPVQMKFQSVWNNAQDIPSPDQQYNHAAQYAGGGGAQLAASRAPKWDWLVRALRDSEHVAMYLGWWDSAGVRQGGHYVNVTGTAAFSGTRQIRFVDDSRQDTSGGGESVSAYWSVSREGYPRLLDMSWPNRICFVEAIVASAIDTSVKFVRTGIAQAPTNDAFRLTVGQNPTRVTEPVFAELFTANAGRYRISMCDITGREVSLLHDGVLSVGATRYIWNGETFGGGRTPGGVYVLSVTGAGRRASAKIVRY